MSDEKDGGTAFPTNAGEHGIEPASGVSLRDWFAGQVLVGKYVDGTSDHDSQWQSIAAQAYRAAAAMLKARKP